VINESIGIPPHLSLPLVRDPELNLSHDTNRAVVENGTNDEGFRKEKSHDDDTPDRDTRRVAGCAARAPRCGEEAYAAQVAVGERCS
jgi:hypothetical protein